MSNNDFVSFYILFVLFLCIIALLVIAILDCLKSRSTARIKYLKSSLDFYEKYFIENVLIPFDFLPGDTVYLILDGDIVESKIDYINLFNLPDLGGVTIFYEAHCCTFLSSDVGKKIFKKYDDAISYLRCNK